MKKIFLFLAVASAAVFTGCSNDDNVGTYVDNDTYSEVFERNITFTGPNYSAVVPLTPAIYDSDVILVYRRAVDNTGVTVWQPIPRTIYFDNGGELDYDFNFTSGDVQIFMQNNNLVDLSTVPAYTQNQTFRIVIVPGYFSGTVDVNNYDAVIHALEGQGNEITIEN